MAAKALSYWDYVKAAFHRHVTVPLLGDMPANKMALAVFGVLGGSAAAVLLLLSAPGLIGGFALLTQRSWARLYAMVLAAVLLFWFPLGTILGAYTLYVLLQPETRFYLEAR